MLFREKYEKKTSKREEEDRKKFRKVARESSGVAHLAVDFRLFWESSAREMTLS